VSVGERKIVQARMAADHLQAIGEHKHAEAVRSLCRSNSALVETCRRLRADLIAAGQA
jgi:hypothetical protein